MPRAKGKADKALRAAQQRGLADALAQERLALAAITKVMLLEVDDPRRVLVRLDSMVRAAEGNRRVPPGTRRALLDGARLVRRTIERERAGAVQTALDPARPEPKTERVDELAAATDGPQQLGLVTNETFGADVEEAHDERVALLERVHAGVIAVLRDHGAQTDAGMYERYSMKWMRGADLPHQTRAAIVDRRRELVAAGRLRAVPREPGDSSPRYDLVERELLEAM